MLLGNVKDAALYLGHVNNDVFCLRRTNTAAFKILTLLNKYQKCNLVEVLSYHDCDSRSRNTIELDCLIKLQAQTMQHRHVVFLTGKFYILVLFYVCLTWLFLDTLVFFSLQKHTWSAFPVVWSVEWWWLVLMTL